MDLAPAADTALFASCTALQDASADPHACMLLMIMLLLCMHVLRLWGQQARIQLCHLRL